MSSINCSIPKYKVPSTVIDTNIKIIVACYIIVFLFAFIGNVTMFLILTRNQRARKKRVHMLLFHSTVAHLFVTLLYIPKEIIHKLTVIWSGGDILCKACKFMDVFGVTLSAYILICICLDRFVTIYFPFKFLKGSRLVKYFLATAWIMAILTCLPSLFIFEVVLHPCSSLDNSYYQCVSKNLIDNNYAPWVMGFSILNLFEVYLIPLAFIVVCYGAILWKIRRSSIKSKNNPKNGKLILRSTGKDNMKIARNKTLRMTLIIVIAFLACWTPYSIMTLQHFLSLPGPVFTQKWPLFKPLIYAFAVFNSAISPYLYGYFSFNLKEELKFLIRCAWKPKPMKNCSATNRSDYETKVSIRNRHIIKYEKCEQTPI
uniref:G_PROTEIN_RECEP_F1_2 domain-containing protein n=1 Tax=Parastrongyloides trichosuri TaxID=131310 RepID=A0A0N4ZEW2_PARTI